MPKKKPLIKVADNYWVHDVDTLYATYEQFDYDAAQFVDGYHYEITITFNPRFHTKASALASKEVVVQKLLSWTDADILNIATEYQKNGFAHYHIHVISPIEIDGDIRWDVGKSFERSFGITSFKPVIDVDRFVEYYLKDVKVNNTERGYLHLTQYVKK